MPGRTNDLLPEAARAPALPRPQESCGATRTPDPQVRTEASAGPWHAAVAGRGPLPRSGRGPVV
eukprot:7491525-Lingulodinium_polyedra.AAC.1